VPHLTLDVQKGQLTTYENSPPPLPPEVDKEPPRLPSRYRLQKILGQGASGLVYKAFDTVLNRTVAIKQLSSPLAMPSTDTYQELLKEARATSKLQHPHIVTIYDITEVDGQICLVMEYLRGQTLRQLLQRKPRLLLKRVIVLLEQAASALDFAHANEVIHRDIKPANLIITRAGLKLTDFGIAKILDDPQTGDSTGVKGTVHYMSPEQINQQPLDGRSDLFALATVAFEMLSGTSPWAGETILQVMNNIVAADVSPRSLVEFKVHHAAALDRVFRKALAKNREERFRSGADFVQALNDVIFLSPLVVEPKYPMAAIRNLLKAALSDQEFDILCFDHFKPVYLTFADDMGLDKKIQNLLDYCDRQEQITDLLSRIKEQNPNQYRRFEAAVEESLKFH
jgi:serine/threonine protein kinase